MSQKSLSRWLKVIILLMAVCGLAIYAYVLPKLIMPAATNLFVGLSNGSKIWIYILWVSAVPCYIVLVYGWLIAKNIGIDKSFTIMNSIYLKNIMLVTLIDCIYFFVANIIMLRLKMSTETIFIISMLMIFAGIVVAIAAACLSHLVLKAAKLQEQSDLTI